MSKQILYGSEAREKILAGVNALTDAVAATLGPAGRNAIIYNRHDWPLSTRDGVTVAKSISFEDLAMDAGAQLVKQAAANTAEQAGDGTTTSTILARAIYREGIRLIGEKTNPVALKRGIEKAVDFICKKGGELDKHAQPVIGDGIVAVATISANNDAEIGCLIAQAIRKAGRDGVITVEESRTLETSLESVEGMKLDSGYISPYFVNNPERQEAVLEDCFLLICEQKLGSLSTVKSLLEQVAQSGKPLFVIAEDVEGEVLPVLVVNQMQGRLASCAVKAPGVGAFRKELLGDIAALTGGRAVVNDLGATPENVKLADLGRAKKIIVSRTATTIIADDSNKSAVDGRISAIRTQMNLGGSEYEKDRLQERLAKLSGGVSIIKVGAGSQVEMSEKKARIEDALFATRCAVEEGIVPGGGVTLARLVGMFYDSGVESQGMGLVMNAMQQPLIAVANNAGEDGMDVLDKVLLNGNFNFGFNALTGEYGDMLAMGILDPVKVVRVALQNAASVAATMLLTETLIIESIEEKKAAKLPGR
jgi:chaperonin GroEL